MLSLFKLFSKQPSSRVVADAPERDPSPPPVRDEEPPVDYCLEDFLADDPKDRMPRGYTKRLKVFLRWKPVEEITYLEPLTEEQHFQARSVDARGRTVAGKLFFYPPAGTVLSAGQHVLEATFIPDNDQKYQLTKESREITVQKRRPQTAWTLSSHELTYRVPLSEDIFAGLTCELTEGSWEYSHTAGSILSVGKHKFSAEYFPSAREAVNYSHGFASVEVDVITTRVPLAWTLPDKPVLEYPAPLPSWLFCAQALFSDADGFFTYTPSEDSVLPAGQHVLTATFHPTERLKYHPSHISLSIEILPTHVPLDWSQPLPIPAGDPLGPTTLNASNSWGLAGDYVYLPCAGTALAEGEHDLQVTFHPVDSNYCVSTTTVKLRVYPKRVLRLQWFEPDTIRYPTRLSRQQLNASLVGFGCHTEGEYLYDPPAGALLPAGTHTLRVTFQPVRQSFLPAHSAVTLTVLPCMVRLVWHVPDPILHGEGLYDSVLNCQVSYPPNVAIVSPTAPLDEDSGGEAAAERLALPAESEGSDPVLVGHFDYQPPYGAMLEAGSHRLRAKFIPRDRLNYTVASTQVELIIRERPKFRARLHWPLLTRSLTSAAPGAGDAAEAGGPSEKAVDEVLQGLESLLAAASPKTSSAKLDASRAKHKLQERLKLAREAEDVGAASCTDQVVFEEIYGESLGEAVYTATCTNAQGKFVYTPNPEALLSAGEHVITATFHPDPVKSPLALSSSLSARIRILPRTPVLDWKLHSETGDLLYGEPLDRDYRRVLAVWGERDKRPISGTYLFDPPRGSVLEAGPRRLHITFLPEDGLNFTSISAWRDVFVHRAVPRILWRGPDRPLDYPHAVLSPPAAEGQGADGAGEEGGVTHRRSLLGWPVAVNANSLLAGEEDNSKASGLAAKPPEPLEGDWEFSFPPRTSLPAGEHTLTCRFYPRDIINYYGASASLAVTVRPALPAIVWQPEPVLVYETPLSLDRHCNAVCEVDGVFIYDPPPGNVLSASGKALVQMSFTPVDTQNYQTVTLVKRLEVQMREAVLVWPLPRRLPYGTVVSAEHLTASLALDQNSTTTLSRLASAASFHYTPALGDVPRAGQRVKFTVRVTPPEEWRRDYSVVTKVVEVEVFRAPPPLTWRPRFTHLFEGEVLGSTHLCAHLGSQRDQARRLQAIFPGSFSYTPGIGTALPPGRHAVTCSWTPFEAENALPTSAVVNFDVTKRAPKIRWEKDPATGKMVCIKLGPDGEEEKEAGGSPKKGKTKQRRSPDRQPGDEGEKGERNRDGQDTATSEVSPSPEATGEGRP